jgi:hypothetical protein
MGLLKWDSLSEAQADEIEAFIRAKGPFHYALRGDLLRQWTCEKYSRTRGTPNTISAELRADFSLVE